MNELIPFAETINTLTTDSKLRQRLHDNFEYHAITKGLIYTNKTTKHYQVDAKQFYDWVKKKFPDLKANIPDEYRLARCIFSLDQTYNLTALPPFTNLEEAAVIIQAQADEIEDLKQQIEEINQACAEYKIKADKWDNWNAKKGHHKK